MTDSFDLMPVNKRTTTVTFRIDVNIIHTLRTESEGRQISLNTLVNQILNRYTEWEMFEERMGMISLTKPIVVKLFNKMSEEEVLDLANSAGKKAVKDIAIFMGNEIDLDSFLRWFEIRMKRSAAEFSHTAKNGIHTCVIKHELGTNWSLYHKTILQAVLHDFFGRTADIITTDNILKFSIKGYKS